MSVSLSARFLRFEKTRPPASLQVVMYMPSLTFKSTVPVKGLRKDSLPEKEVTLAVFFSLVDMISVGINQNGSTGHSPEECGTFAGINSPFNA